MGDEQKEIVRIEAFWIDTWLRSQYQNLEIVYIVHDAVAKEVDQHTFFHLRESGGTQDLVRLRAVRRRSSTTRFPPDDWNIYPFHFSDGDNWRQPRHRARASTLLRERAAAAAQPVLLRPGRRAPTASGQFKKDLDSALRGTRSAA